MYIEARDFFLKNGQYPKMRIWDFRNLKAYFAWKKQMSELEQERLRVRQLRHEFYWLQEHARSICPKSITGYSRMKNAKSKKYIELKEFAYKKGFSFVD